MCLSQPKSTTVAIALMYSNNMIVVVINCVALARKPCSILKKKQGYLATLAQGRGSTDGREARHGAAAVGSRAGRTITERRASASAAAASNAAKTRGGGGFELRDTCGSDGADVVSSWIADGIR